MKILNMMQCTHLGGTEQFALRLMAGLMERGHQCRVVSLHPIAELGPLLDSNHIEAISVGYKGKFGWRSHFRLRHALRTVSYDSLLMTGPTLTGILALPPPKKSCKRVLAVHFHHEGVKPHWQWRLLYDLANARFDTLTFASNYIRDEAVRINPSIAEKAKTVYIPIPSPRLVDKAEKRKSRAELNIDTNGPVVGNAGWLIPRKRYDVFLKVAAKIKAVLPSARFVIAGDGPEKAKLIELSNNLGLTDSVRWLGWRKDLGAFYRSLDLLLFNSDWDTFPTTPLEALSYAVPVVASVQHGGLKEVITDSRYGRLVQVHDIDSLSRYALELLQDEAAAVTVGRAGRERVQQLCSVEECVDTYSNLLGLSTESAARKQSS